MWAPLVSTGLWEDTNISFPMPWVWSLGDLDPALPVSLRVDATWKNTGSLAGLIGTMGFCFWFTYQRYGSLDSVPGPQSPTL